MLASERAGGSLWVVRRFILAAPLLLSIFALALAAACGGDGAPPPPAKVTIEALTPASSAPSAVPTGGKGAAPPSATPGGDVQAASAATATPPAEATPAGAEPTATAAPGPQAPATGRWIEVDVTSFTVRLMDGETVVREIAPVGVGEQIDTGAYLSTQTGLFHVNSKNEALVYDAPYKTYISHWVGFDPARDNGFHSFLKDADGSVVDASTGRVSNGCIRTGEAEAIFAFAEIGMPVWVHA